jgi:RNA polymerase sigma-70 factor, ECF subfamily
VKVPPPKTPIPPALLRDCFERRGPWIYAAVSRIVSNPELARVLVIETFWCASQNPRIGALELETLSVWLRLKARNLAIAFLRLDHVVIAHPAKFRAEYLKCATDLERISIALLRLEPHQREMFELSYFEGLSHSEIAGITGRALGTVKSWVRYSRLSVDKSAQDHKAVSERRH